LWQHIKNKLQTKPAYVVGSTSVALLLAALLYKMLKKESFNNPGPPPDLTKNKMLKKESFNNPGPPPDLTKKMRKLRKQIEKRPLFKKKSKEKQKKGPSKPTVLEETDEKQVVLYHHKKAKLVALPPEIIITLTNANLLKAIRGTSDFVKQQIKHNFISFFGQKAYQEILVSVATKCNPPLLMLKQKKIKGKKRIVWSRKLSRQTHATKKTKPMPKSKEKKAEATAQASTSRTKKKGKKQTSRAWGRAWAGRC